MKIILVKFIHWKPKMYLGFAILMFLTKLNAQQKFTFSTYHDRDSVVWYVKNLSQENVKLSAATLDFFYKSDNVMIWPYTYFGGNKNFRKIGKFCGEKNCWKYKSEIGLGLDAWVAPGDSFPIVSGDNYAAASFDTLMLANFELFWYDTNGISHKNTVLPPKSNGSCEFVPLFETAGSSKTDGIRLGSNSWFQLHEGSKNYLFGSNIAIAILFDNYSLKPYWVSSVFPQNPAGRMIKNFGYPIDSQVFYQFNIYNSKYTGMQTLDSIIDGMSTGDYIAIVSYSQWSGGSANAANGYNAFGSLKKSFESIGLNMDTLFPGCSYSLLGRKGLAVGKAKFNVNHICNPAIYSIFNLKTAMISNAPTNEMYDYPSCYEKFIYKLSPYVPKPKGRLNQITSRLNVYPNPSFEGHWTITLPQGASKIEVVDAVGRTLFVNTSLNGFAFFELNASLFNILNTQGVYVARIYNHANQLLTVGRLVN